MARQIWLLAGGNGAGKSTFYHTRLEPKGMGFVNADLIAKELDPLAPEAMSYKAAEIAMSRFHQYIQHGYSFCYETVFSHPSKLEMIRAALDEGYSIVLVYISLRDPKLHLARVDQRTKSGGHNVDQTKILDRLPRSQRYVGQAASLATEVLVFDNSELENPFQLLARKKQGQLECYIDPMPQWLVGFFGL